MHTLTIAFGAMATTLSFRTAEAAQAAFQLASNTDDTNLLIADEFGAQLFVPIGEVKGAVIDNLLLSKEARIEMGLHQARTQHAAQQRVSSDPVLRQSSIVGGGPAMLSPMGPGPNGRGF